MKIGMIVAIAEEIDALLADMGTPINTSSENGFTIRQYELDGSSIYVAQSGAGEIYAAAAVQYLITKYSVDLIVNFGICGGLIPDMSLCRACVVEKVVHYDRDTSSIDNIEPGRYEDLPELYIHADKRLVSLALQTEPSLIPVICASADKFVSDSEAKLSLNRQFGAHICEMEAAGILLTANRCEVPALLIKAVSDSVNGGAEEFELMAKESAAVCVKTMRRIIERIQPDFN